MMVITKKYLGNILETQVLLHVKHWLDGSLHTLVTDIPELFPVLVVAELLDLHPQFTNLSWLKMAGFLLHGEGQDNGELLTDPVDISLVHVNLDLRNKEH